MTNPLHTSATRRRAGANSLFALLGSAVAGLALLFSMQAGAAAPEAGSIIGNQASATYVDAGGVTRTATSNRVDTIVDSVYGLTLTADGTKYAAPGAQVTFPHTLTNTGNTEDSYTLSAADGGSAVTLTNVKIYEDLNGDGTPDNFVNLNGTNVTVAYGGNYKFVIVGTVPGTATGGSSGSLTIDATSVGDGAQTASNTDTIHVSDDAVIGVVKSMSATSGESPSGPYTVTLAYTNTGNNTATDLSITDSLPAGMSYVASTGVWSVGGATLTDASDVEAATGITYTSSGNVIVAVIASVAPGDSGTVSFQVTIDGGLAPQTLDNKGVFTFDPDGAGPTGTTPNTDTNIVTFTVIPTAAVTISDTGATDTLADSDTDLTLNDISLIASAQEGSTVIFQNVVTNTGSGTDTFNITVANTSFPAGTTFVLLKSDGVTPLADTDGDNVLDTGPLAASGVYNIFVKAILPPDSATAVPSDATVTATSSNTPGVSDTVVDRITEITASTVDLTNNVSLAGGAVATDGSGVQATGEALAITTLSVTPSNATNTATFVLFVNNTSSLGDSYELKASTDNTFGTITLPTGWSVKFYVDADGTDGGADGVMDAGVTQSTSTGAILSSANKLVWAVVSIPQNFSAGTYDIYFRAQSPSTGATDVKHDAVTVETIRAISLAPSNSGQVYPGGSVVYQHTLKNAGNATETTINLSSTDSKLADGWSSVIYEDTDGSGDLSASDLVISSVSNLGAGVSKTLFVKVFAPAGALEGVVDTTTLDADAGGGITATVNDTTTVIVGDLTLTKKQGLDLNCDGDTADAGEIAFRTTQISSGAVPGSCLLYQITAANSGIDPITTVVVNDATPSFTTYELSGSAGTCSGGATTSVGTITASPADGGVGTITATVGTLAAGSSAVIEFCVQIDQ